MLSTANEDLTFDNFYLALNIDFASTNANTMAGPNEERALLAGVEDPRKRKKRASQAASGPERKKKKMVNGPGAGELLLIG
jgi:hypothetical protein